MKRLNKHVEDTRDQIVNTLQVLTNCGLARITQDVFATSSSGFEILTWYNHVWGRHNAGKSFATLDQYISIYETGAYHCIIFDGSIIRAFFKFEKNILKVESLLYWPAPIIIPEDYVYEFGIREAVNMCFADENSRKDNVIMRTPIRFDFNSSNSGELHPITHVHMQHAECRISAKKPICFNTFIKFIFNNFYSDKCPPILNNLDPLNYSGFEVCKDAVISI